MFNSVQYVRSICKERKITISQLEKDCGFANGYLNPKKMSKISYDRAVIIAQYLDISVEDILNGPENKNAPTESGERLVTDDDIKFALFGGRSEEITDAMYTEVKQFAHMVKLREDMKKKET